MHIHTHAHTHHGAGHVCPISESISCVHYRAGINFYGGIETFDDHFTFRSFGRAMMTLFRCATADSWETRLYFTRDFTSWAPLYYITFMILCSMVLLNLFIAVILVRCLHIVV